MKPQQQLNPLGLLTPAQAIRVEKLKAARLAMHEAQVGDLIDAIPGARAAMAKGRLKATSTSPAYLIMPSQDKK